MFTTEQKQTIEPLLISSMQAAKSLGICERQLFTMTKNGSIPCVRIGKRVLYDIQDLRQWIDQQKTK
jgi:excisionase family DNA binding protein